MARRISTTISNPLRTAAQGTPAVLITEFIDAFIKDLDERQYAALAGILLLVFSVAQNAWENYRDRKAKDLPALQEPA